MPTITCLLQSKLCRISDIADSLDSGVQLAKDCIKEGGGIKKLNQLIDYSSTFK